MDYTDDEFPSFNFTVLSLSLYAKIMEKQELSTAIDSIRSSSDKLIEQIDVNYNNSLMINEIGLSLSKQMDIDSILSNVIQILETRLYYDRGMILFSKSRQHHVIISCRFWLYS